MPELPEVETTRQGISPFLLQQEIHSVVIRQPKLRLIIPPEFSVECRDKKILAIERRGKYLVFQLSQGYLLNHLGMSGHLRLVDGKTPVGKHDHVDFCFKNEYILRYTDPRRFGLWLYVKENPFNHPLLAHLGPEPLSDFFNADCLFLSTRQRKQAIKSLIMSNEVVVGVGNIYATESLFLAGIHPKTAAGQLSKENLVILVQQIKTVLQQAIAAGGTTLRDFYASNGRPGYFVNKLQIYGRQNQPCFRCKNIISSLIIGGRQSAFCPSCQAERN